MKRSGGKMCSYSKKLCSSLARLSSERDKDEQTEVRTPFSSPQYILPLTMALLTSYTVSAHYASYRKEGRMMFKIRAGTMGLTNRTGRMSRVRRKGGNKAYITTRSEEK